MSPLFRKILTGVFNLTLSSPYCTGWEARTIKFSYLLDDGIYTNWPIFVKPIHASAFEEETKLTTWHESVGKDLEWCYGFLQSRFKVLSLESYRWDIEDIVVRSEVCVILHNLLICITQNLLCQWDENKADVNLITELLEGEDDIGTVPMVVMAALDGATTGGETNGGDNMDNKMAEL